VGLVIRVSTDRQAMNPEGSLKTQLQRLHQHIEYKTAVCGEDWTEVRVYELRGISGKCSARSAEFQEMFADIRSGRVNTVLCTALERVCRSVKDFLHFFEFLNEHGVEFVCLKQNYDTTTAQGKLFVTIMMALAEFEREQTAERTRDATAARSERGLWNGGRLIGYDLDTERKGYLIPNSDETALVNFAFDSYLQCGSIAQTTEALNRNGYRTKTYTSRRGVCHPGKEFTLTSVQYLLKNSAYIGKKEINKRGNGHRLVAAVWLAIVDEEKFEQVQRLMETNTRTNHNGSRPVRHVYVLSNNLLHCGRCGSPMEGRSGTGHLGVKYFYYVCRRPDCGLRVSAEEIESAVLGRIQELAGDHDLLDRLVDETNRRLARQRPVLLNRRRRLQKGLDEVSSQAERILTEWTALDQEAGRAFLTEKLAGLAARRADLERGLIDAERALSQLEEGQVTARKVQAALGEFSKVYGCLTPHERKELIRLALRRVEVSDRQISMELYAFAAPQMEVAQSRSRPEPPNWLPEQVSRIRYYAIPAPASP
jgi:site-specific DNA recombinase